MNIVSTSTFGPLNTSSFPNTLRLQNLSSVILQGMPADVKTLVLNTRLTDFGRGTLATAYPQIICKALTTSITTLLYRGISQYVYRSLDTTGFLPNQYNLSISLFNSSNGIVSSEISLTSSIARTWTYNTQNFTLRNIYCGGQLIGWLLTS
jgi:hypothetical protein